MSRLAIRKWKMIVAAKDRRRERIEQDLVRERKALAERKSALDEAARAHREARERRFEHEARIVALIDGAETLGIGDYLRHDSWRTPLKEACEAASAAEQKAHAAFERQQQKVRETEAALARAEAALDQCRRKLDALVRSGAHAAELAADEEAAENLLARRRAHP